MDEGKTPPVSRENVTPEATLYNRSFFERELHTSRKLLFHSHILPILYTSLLMWICLNLYWGSAVSSNLSKLSVYAINLDSGVFGEQMLQEIKAPFQDRVNSLGWHFDDSVLSNASSRDLIVDERTWAAVQGVLFL